MSTLSPDRRSLVRAAAWSVPAISAAAAAPSLAASNGTREPEYQNVTKTFIFAEQDSGSEVTVSMTASSVPLSVPEAYRLSPMDVNFTVTVANPSAFLIGSDLGDPDVVRLNLGVSVEFFAGFSRTVTEVIQASSGVVPAIPFVSSVSSLLPTVSVPPDVAPSMGSIAWSSPPLLFCYGYNADGARNGERVTLYTNKIAGNDYEWATFAITS